MAPALAHYSPLGDNSFGEPGPLDADDFDESRQQHELELAEKERFGPDDRGQDTVEEENDSDAEAAGLLGNGKAESVDNAVDPAAASKRLSRGSDPGGSHGGRNPAWAIWGGRAGGGMTPTERALFAKEMFSQVRATVLRGAAGRGWR